MLLTVELPLKPPLYDTLSKKEAGILAQLHASMARISAYLHRVEASEINQCERKTTKKTVKHFVLLCARWDHLQAHLLQQPGTRIGDISFYLEGRSKKLELDLSP